MVVLLLLHIERSKKQSKIHTEMAFLLQFYLFSLLLLPNIDGMHSPGRKNIIFTNKDKKKTINRNIQNLV